MTTSRWFRTSLWALLAGGMAATSSPAAAECATDADCDAGFVCMSFGTVDCGFACPEGEKCPDMPPDCAPMEIKECSSAPCSADSDCPDDMVCWEQTYLDCPPAVDFACPPEGDCPEPAPAEECTEKSDAYCVAKYIPPCTEDADCGPGFKCTEIEIGMCSGSAGSAGGSDPGAGGGSEPVPEPAPEPECTSTPSGEFYCELIEMTCTDASGCPDGFTCEANPNDVVCSAPAEMPSGDGSGEGGAGGADGSAGSGEEIDPCGASTEPTEMVCMPPYWNSGFGRGAADSGGVTSLESGADGSAKGGDNSVTGAPGAGAPVPSMAAGEGAPAATGGGDVCSVGSVGASQHTSFATLASLFTLGLLAFRRRRAA